MRGSNITVGFVFSDKMKLALDTVEASKDILWFLSGDVIDLSCFLFVLPNYLVLMNGQELNVCSLLPLNVNCFDSIGCGCGQLAVKHDSLSQG